jgi:quaternary ammonium compound-resistance protein SugE
MRTMTTVFDSGPTAMRLDDDSVAIRTAFTGPTRMRVKRADRDDGLIRMAWFALLLAGFLEIAWALGLKYSAGFTRLWPSLATFVAIGLSFGLLGLSLKSVPFGTAYAIWTGIGAAGAAIAGIVLFGESASVARVGCLALIVAGTIGLKLATPD